MKKSIIAMLLLCSISFAMYGGEGLSVGDNAPGFKAIDDQGNQWKSKNHFGETIVVVYFYPAAMTGGCTKQACAYRDNKSQLQDLGVEVVGISGDKPENLKYFKQAENLNFTLLSDPDGSIAGKFGVPLRDGGEIKRQVEGQEVVLERGTTISRWTFVVDQNGKIIYKNKQVNPEQDVKNVIQAIQDKRN